MLARWPRLPAFAAAFALCLMRGAFAADALPLVGAIRWDAWFKGSEFGVGGIARSGFLRIRPHLWWERGGAGCSL